MTSDLLTWAAMIEVPVFVAIFRLIIKNRRELDGSALEQKQQHDQQVSLLKDGLADFKLHVARSYVSVAYLKDVEKRLTDHLLRIEKKLDHAGRAYE